jgi:RHH-type proline utilization regulon transcriptional repressor/proline dehydrogenase/delta 1-pyrroline-5-carboxylate dehydrogenase
MVAVKSAETTREIVEFAPLPPRDEIASHYLIDEQRLLDRLIERAVFSEDERRRSTDLARRLV